MDTEGANHRDRRPTSSGLHGVAKVIETKAQERFLAEHGCDEFRGFRFGVPVPADEVLRSIGGRALERGKDR